METEEQGGNHILIQETRGNVQPPVTWVGAAVVPFHTCYLPPVSASVLAPCGMSGLHSKKGPAKGSAADGEHGIFQLAERECGVTGLAKLQGGLEAFNY